MRQQNGTHEITRGSQNANTADTHLIFPPLYIFQYNLLDYAENYEIIAIQCCQSLTHSTFNTTVLASIRILASKKRAVSAASAVACSFQTFTSYTLHIINQSMKIPAPKEIYLFIIIWIGNLWTNKLQIIIIIIFIVRMCLRSHALAFAAFGRQLECLLCYKRKVCRWRAKPIKICYQPSRTSVLSSRHGCTYWNRWCRRAMGRFHDNYRPLCINKSKAIRALFNFHS